MGLANVDFESVVRAVNEHGFTMLRSPNGRANLDSFLIECGEQFGRPVGHRTSSDLVQSLFVTEKEVARHRSLSRLCGSGEFPLHVDTAHWETPCRFIVLGCEVAGSGETATTLVRWEHLVEFQALVGEAHRAIFKVVNGGRSFYSTILDSSRSFIRFDQGCMKGIDDFALKVMEDVSVKLRELPLQRIVWQSGAVVIIDNWRTLHGRESFCSEVSSERHLKRVLVV